MFEIEENLIEDIRGILKSLEENFVDQNEIDENLKIVFYDKVRHLPNSDEIITEFERVFARDVNDNSKVHPKLSNRAKRDAKGFLPPEVERKQTCVEVFADFGAFFNKSISKFGFKYCSESEIVRRSEAIAMPKIEERSADKI